MNLLMKAVYIVSCFLILLAVVNGAEFNVYQPQQGVYEKSPEFWVYLQHEEPGEVWLELNGERFYSADTSPGNYPFLEGETFDISEGDYSYAIVLETSSDTFRSETHNFSIIGSKPVLDIDFDRGSREVFYRTEWNSSGELRLLSDQQVLQIHEFRPPENEYRFPIDGRRSFRLEFDDGDQTYQTGDLVISDEELQFGLVNRTESENSQIIKDSDEVFDIKVVFYGALILAVLFLAVYLRRNLWPSESDEESNNSKPESIAALKEKYR